MTTDRESPFLPFFTDLTDATLEAAALARHLSPTILLKGDLSDLELSYVVYCLVIG